MTDYSLDGGAHPGKREAAAREAYPGEWEAAAREAQLIRQRNLGRGWRPGGWRDPGELLRQLDERQCDPVEARALARMRTAQRLHADAGRTTAAQALAWLAEHAPRNVS